ncbi:unnamed protein product, partial [marine sediment metagenome]
FAEYDAIVIGYGAAGGGAAISAYDSGASVIILEKMSTPGGNSRVSGGGLIFPKDSRDSGRFSEYLRGVCLNTVEPELVDTFVRELMECPDWLREMGGELKAVSISEVFYSKFHPTKTFSGAPGAEGLELALKEVKQTNTCPEPNAGARLWGCLAREVERKGIKVMLSTPAKELVKNQKGEVVGVIAKSEGEDLLIKAKKGVLLALSNSLGLPKAVSLLVLQ